jgi:IS4 transposase
MTKSTLVAGEADSEIVRAVYLKHIRNWQGTDRGRNTHRVRTLMYTVKTLICDEGANIREALEQTEHYNHVINMLQENPDLS